MLLSSVRYYTSTVWIQFIDILTRENHMQMESVTPRLSERSWQRVRTLRLTNSTWMAGRGLLQSLFLSVSHSSSSISQPWHEYKWRPVKSRDPVPVNGFLLGLRQQHSPNGFSLTGFNHVPWYPLKRMQIVNQTSLSTPPCFPISCCCLRLVPRDHPAIIHLALTSNFLFLQAFTY